MIRESTVIWSENELNDLQQCKKELLSTSSVLNSDLEEQRATWTSDDDEGSNVKNDDGKVSRGSFPRGKDILSLPPSDTGIPYALTVQQGFQMIQKLRCRHPLLCAVRHDKLGANFTMGRDRDESGNDTSPSSSETRTKDETANEQEPVSESMKPNYPTPKSTTVHFVAALDRDGILYLWDLGRSSAGVHPNRKVFRTMRLMTDVTKFVFMKKFGMYAACCHDTKIKLFTSRFEYTACFKSCKPVFIIRYNQEKNELIAAGSSHITVWCMDATVVRNVVKIEAREKFTLETGLPNDQWIRKIYTVEKLSLIFAVIDTKVLIYHAGTGMLIDRIPYVSNRQITAIMYHEKLAYKIIGCADGTIKVWNAANALVHEYHGHSKAVTALAMYPYGPSFISSSDDCTLRLWSIKTFKEVYRIDVRDAPLHIEVMDNQRLFVQSNRGVQIYLLNHLNTDFLTANSPVRKLSYEKSSGVPGRILALAEDGIARLISPVSGKIITTSIPFLDSDVMLDITYSSKTSQLYLLLSSREIWTISTSLNPCSVVDIWRGGSTREDIRCLCLYEETHDAKHDEGPVSDGTKELDYSVLFGGTQNGQVLLFTNTGDIYARYQIHTGPVEILLAEPKQRLMFTGSADGTVNICSVDVTAEHSSWIFQTKITIAVNVRPNLMSVMGETICVTSDETVSTWTFDLGRKSWVKSPAHSSNDDHTEAITGLCCRKKMGIFVTVSKDGILKVWDPMGTLIREVQFSEPLHSVCFANGRADLLIGISGRIDLISNHAYLPPAYLHRAMTFPRKTVVEEPIPFNVSLDESRYILQNLNGRYRPIQEYTHSQMGARRAIHLNRLDARPTLVTIASQHIGGEEDRPVVPRWESNSDLRAKLDNLALRRQHMIEMTNKEAEIRALQEREKEAVIQEGLQKYLRFVRYAEAYARNQEVQISLQSEPSETDLYEQALALFGAEFVAGMSGFARKEKKEPKIPVVKISEEEEEGELFRIDLGKSEFHLAGSTGLVEESFGFVEGENTIYGEGGLAPSSDYYESGIPGQVGNRVLEKHRPVFIAPDGSIPNSSAKHEVEEWLQKHQQFKMADLSINVGGLNKHKEVAVVENTVRKKKSEEYKAKLAQLLAAMPKEEPPKVEVEPEEEIEETPLPASPEPTRRLRLPIPRKGGPVLMAVSPAALLLEAERKNIKPAQEEPLPQVVTKGLKYDWMREQDLFFPSLVDTRLTVKRLRVPGTPDNLLELVIGIYQDFPDNMRVRSEILEYIKWMNQEFGFTSPQALVDFYCAVLQRDVGRELTSEETELYLAVMGQLEQYASYHTEVLNTFFILLDPINPQIRNVAAEVLAQYGECNLTNPHLKEKLDTLFQRIAQLNQPKSDNIAELKDDKNETGTVSEDADVPKVEGESAAIPMAGNENEPKTTTVEGEETELEAPKTVSEVMNHWIRSCLRQYAIHRAGKNRNMIQQLQKLDLFGNEKKSSSNPIDTSVSSISGSRPNSRGTQLGSEGSRPTTGRKSSSAGGGMRSGTPHGTVLSGDMQRGSAGGIKKSKKKPKKRKKAAAKQEDVRPEIDPPPEIKDDLPAQTDDDKAEGEAADGEARKLKRPNTTESANAVLAFVKPTPTDIILSVEHFVKVAEKLAEKTEKARLAVLAEENSRMERIRIAAEQAAAHAAAQAEYLEKREREKHEKERLQKEKIKQLMAGRSGHAPLPVLNMKRNKHVHSHIHEGLTHPSACHPSRETLALNIQFPPIETDVVLLKSRIHELTGTLPMGNSLLSPFESAFVSSPSNRYRPPREYSTYGAVDDILMATERASAAYIGVKNAAEQTKEMKDIMGVQKFSTTRQYYVPGLSWAPLEVALQQQQGRNSSRPTGVSVNSSGRAKSEAVR